MKIDNSANLTRLKPLAGLALCILAGSGTLLCTRPALAQADSLQLSPTQPRRVQRPNPQAVGDLEIKDGKLRQCVPEANSDKKKCTDVVSGYSQILSYGNDLYNQRNLAAAETIFRGLIREFPKEAAPHLKLGIVLERRGQMEAAISEYRQAIEINSKYAVARNSLGVALARQGQLQEAITEWRQALEMNAEYADALTNLGLGLLQQGNKDEGVANLKRARDLFVQQRDLQKVKQIEELLREVESQAT